MSLVAVIVLWLKLGQSKNLSGRSRSHFTAPFWNRVVWQKHSFVWNKQLTKEGEVKSVWLQDASVLQEEEAKWGVQETPGVSAVPGQYEKVSGFKALRLKFPIHFPMAMCSVS